MGDIDITSKVLVHRHPRDWLAVGGLPTDGSINAIDADLSTLSSTPDKLLRVDRGKAGVSLVHLEFQSGFDEDLDGRVLTYNVLARWRHKLPVESLIFLQRPAADSKRIIGGVRSVSEIGRLEFDYRLVRVWQMPVEMLLTGGIGTLPLAPIADVERKDLPAVVDRIKRRVEREIAPPDVGDFWLATEIMLGLRYEESFAKSLLRGVRQMKESTTYQAIVDIGRTEGIATGMATGMARGLVDGERRVLLRLATAKFGPPGRGVVGRLDAVTDPVELERLGLRLLSVSSWDDLLATAPAIPRRRHKRNG